MSVSAGVSYGVNVYVSECGVSVGAAVCIRVWCECVWV